MSSKITLYILSLLLCTALSAQTLRHNVGDHSLAPLKSEGVVRIPVILVQFSDLHFSVAASDPQVNDYFNLFCNGTYDGQLYKGAGSYGAVRDYFVEQSDSLFLPEFVVIGPVTLDSTYAYYGRNSGSVKDVNISAFYTESISQAMTLYPHWNDFDNDGDGSVDMTYFIYAGEGENGSDDTNTIWPKEQTTARTIDGMRFMCYACCNELYGGQCDGIGVMCHELSHALGLPDLYDTRYVAYGLDFWDLMDSGCYCLSSYHPCGYSAYERDFMGWRPLQTLTHGQTADITLRPMSEGGVGYKLQNPANPDEYYILENRQNTGWDTYIGRGSASVKRHGMLLSHIDYVRSYWTSNSVNTRPQHQNYTIVPADGQLDSYMYVSSQDTYTAWSHSASADLYPGTQQVNTLLSARQPIYTSPGTMHMPMTDITEHEDGSITLRLHTVADVNLDGTVDTQDVLAIYQHIQQADDVPMYHPNDINFDGTVDTQDVLGIYQHLQDY